MKTIEFFSTVPGLSSACPIYPAKDLDLMWTKRARQDYIDTVKDAKGTFNHIYQCPGIFDLFKHGYIVPMWHDVVITTNGDDRNYQFMVPSTDLSAMVDDRVLLGKQETGVETLMPTKPWSMTSILKINTPWNVVAPKGVKFIMIPIAYPDSFEFESSIGILDPGVSSEINVQAFWNIRRGEYLLKAGTPLAHIIPLSDENFKLICRDATSLDKLWIEKRKFFNSFTFKLKRGLFKKSYYEHFGK